MQVFDYSAIVVNDDPPLYIPSYTVYKDGVELVASTEATSLVDADVMVDTEYCYTVTQVLEDATVSDPSDPGCGKLAIYRLAPLFRRGVALRRLSARLLHVSSYVRILALFYFKSGLICEFQGPHGSFWWRAVAGVAQRLDSGSKRREFFLTSFLRFPIP